MRISASTAGVVFSLCVLVQPSYAATTIPYVFYEYSFSYEGVMLSYLPRSEGSSTGDYFYLASTDIVFVEDAFKFSFQTETPEVLDFEGEELIVEGRIPNLVSSMPDVTFPFLDYSGVSFSANNVSGTFKFGSDNQIISSDITLSLLEDSFAEYLFASFNAAGVQAQPFDPAQPLPFTMTRDYDVLGYSTTTGFGTWTREPYAQSCVIGQGDLIFNDPTAADYPAACLPTSQVAPIPLPASWMFGMLGLGSLGLFRRLGRTTG